MHNTRRLFFFLFILVGISLTMCGSEGSEAVETPTTETAALEAVTQPATEAPTQPAAEAPTGEPEATAESETEPEVNAEEASPTLATEQIQGATISLSGLPETIEAGERFTVDILVSLPEGVPADAAEIHLSHDPAILSIVRATPGPIFPLTLVDTFTDGLYSYAAGTFSDFPTGITFPLVTLELEGLAPGSTELTFIDPEGAASTLVTSEGASILDEALGGTVVVTESSSGAPQSRFFVYLSFIEEM